jgi:predicted ATPase/DNA-binding winged helix-turn-helix (wHTH) protein
MIMEERSSFERLEAGFAFGRFRLFPARQLLLDRDQVLKLGTRGFDLLCLLVERAGEIVTKDDLMAAAWPSTFVHESNLKVNIYGLRRTLGDTQAQPSYIATIAGRGYRFVAPVRSIAPQPGSMSHLEPVKGGDLPLGVELVGRGREIEQLLASLEVNRHVTLAGAGGVGKTSLALAVARRAASGFPGGICFVDLATIEDGALLPAVISTALHLRGNPAEVIDAVVEHLCSRRMLVVLDNCEHVLASASSFVSRLMRSPGTSSVLATSRQPLGVGDERTFWLSGLTAPEENAIVTAQDISSYPALDLLLRRAAEWTDYKLLESDCQVLGQVCRSLGGLPLALELAAGKLETHSASELGAELDRQLAFDGERGAQYPERQVSLLATIRWSHRLLSRSESALFELVSAFAGTFDLDDAVYMGEVADLGPIDVASALGGLVAKSMVTAQLGDRGLQYRLLDATRRFAAERQRKAERETAARCRHAERMLEVFGRSETEWDWREAREWVATYRSRLSDLRSALSWSFEPGGDPTVGIRLTAAAIPFWFESSSIAEAQANAERALNVARTIGYDSVAPAKLAISRAWSMIYARVLTPDIEAAWRDAIHLGERTGIHEHHYSSLLGFSLYLLQTGQVGRALDSLEQFKRLRVASGDGAMAPEGDRFLALALAYSGRLSESRAILEELARSYPQPDRRSRMAGFQVDRFIGIRCYLPLVAWLQGDVDYAAHTADAAVEAAGRLEHLLSQSNALAQAAMPVALWNGDADALERYSEQLRSNLEFENTAIWFPLRRYFAGAVTELRTPGNGLDEMSAAMEEMVACGLTIRIGMYMASLADALITSGRLEEARALIARAKAYQHQQGEDWYRSELLRVEARALRAAGAARQADQLLDAALCHARAIGARSLELRAANDRAAQHVADGRITEAVAVLEPVYGRLRSQRVSKDVLLASRLLQRARRFRAVVAIETTPSPTINSLTTGTAPSRKQGGAEITIVPDAR